MTLRTKLELQCKEAEENVRTGEANLIKNKVELEALTQKIAEAKEKLQNQVQPKFEEAKDGLTRMTIERNDAQKKMEGLYAKQGRGRQFENKKARDDYLRIQIEELNGAKEDKEAFLNEKRDTLGNLRRSTTAIESELEKKKAELAKNEKTLDSLNESIAEKKRERHEMAEKRKVQWGSLSELSGKVSDARENARRASSSLRKIMPRNTAMGLDALSRIIREEGIVVGEQYFGPVMENIQLVDEKFQTAVEVAAQNALFHVIVDTDATAARLMKRLERDRLGRVTFLPLNQLHVPEPNYPDSRDVVPLLRTCLKFDNRLGRAMNHVFGKKLLANSAEVASTWSSRCGMDAVTLDGDLCSRKGALSGGFVDRNKRLVPFSNLAEISLFLLWTELTIYLLNSRLKANSDLRSAEETLKTLQVEENEMKALNGQVDKQITAIMSDMQRLQAKKANLDHQLTRTDEDISTQATRLESKVRQTEKLESDIIPPVEQNIQSLLNQVKTLEEEVGSELRETLTQDEKNLLKQLKSVQSELEQDIETQTQSLEEVSVERQRLQSLLQDNLLKRKRELEEEGADAEGRRRSLDTEQPASRLAQTQRKENLEQLQREFDEAIQNAEDVEERLAEAKLVDGDLKKKLIDGKRKLETVKTKDSEITKLLEDAQKLEEKLMNKVRFYFRFRRLPSLSFFLF